LLRVLITNAYSARNRGDAGIILGMLESLSRTELLGDAEFRISSADHVNDARWYPVPTVPSFASLRNGFSRIAAANQLYFLSVLLPVSLLWALAWRLGRLDLPVPSRLRRLMREYAGADVVIAAGGGYLYTNSAIRGNIVLLVNLYSFFVAVLLGKPVALYAQSIGPFAGSWQAALVRRVLARVLVVEVREEISQRLLDTWKLSTPVRRVADAAFLLAARPLDRVPNPVEMVGEPVVGMTVRRWFRDRERQATYEATVSSFVQWLLRARGGSVVFLPQVTFVEGSDDDRVVARRIAEDVAPNERVLVVEDELSAPEIKWLCSRTDVFVGTRMHSNIFALSSGVPAVAIAYQPKTTGIMADLGLEEWVVSIEGLDPGELQRVFDALVSRRDEVHDQLTRVMPSVREAAFDAGQIIAELLAERGNV
jgi:colanic acid/amylovoran biosynthesis protein